MKTTHRILSLLVILSVVASLFVVMAAPASAAVTAPTAGTIYHVGDSITVTTGADFIASSTLTILWGKTGSGMGLATPVATTPTTVVATTGGVLSGAAFVIPPGTSSNAGTGYSIWVTDGVSAPQTIAVVVKPKLKLLVGSSDVSLATVAAGTVVTAQGTGFAGGVGTLVRLFTDADANNVFNAGDTIGATVASSTTDATGSFTTTFTVSAGASGPIMAQDLSAAQNANALNTAGGGGVDIGLKASISLSATEGLPGSVITVTGANYTTLPIVTVTVGGAAAAFTAAVGTVGAFTTQVTIPATASPGINQVVLTDTAAVSANATFNVTSRTLTLTPSSGPRGTRVTVSGANMTKSTASPLNSKIDGVVASELTINGAGWNTADILIDSTGAIVPQTFTIPAATALGPAVVVATDNGADFTHATAADNISSVGVFTVTKPTFAISPTSGSKGTTVVISGAGWVPNKPVAVTLSTTTISLTPDGAGAISGSLTVDSSAAVGSNVVTANDGVVVGNTASSTAFVVPPPALSVSPITGPATTAITVSGSGYIGLTAVTVAFDGFTLGQAVTDVMGNFVMNAAVPGFSTGAKVITGTQGATVASTQFTLVSGAPAATTIASAFISIVGKYTIVWTFDAATQTWLVNDVTEGAPDTFTTLAKGQGYWLQVSEDTTLTYLANSYTLKKGWNLIGWLG